MEPIPMLLWCPSCGMRHIDEGEWATRPHALHACQVSEGGCGATWRHSVVPTVGVQSLPGFENVRTAGKATRTTADPERARALARDRQRRRREALASRSVTLCHARDRRDKIPGDLISGSSSSQKEERKEAETSHSESERESGVHAVTQRDVTPVTLERDAGHATLRRAGTFGMEAQSWADGVRSKTNGRPDLPPSCFKKLEEVARERPADVEDALPFMFEDGARFAAECQRAKRWKVNVWVYLDWVSGGRQPMQATGGTHRPVQPWSPDDFDLPKEMSR